MPPASAHLPSIESGFALRTLGAVTLCRADDPILGPGKPVALLAYLAIAPARTASREHLIDLLWADADLERARHALRQTLWQIKQVTGGEPFSGGRDEVTLELPIALDRDRFLAHINAGDLEAAAAAYTGPFFPSFASPGGAAFEHWADLEREHLRTIFARTTERLARRQLADGLFREALSTARHLLTAGEETALARRLLIDAHLGAGDTINANSEADALERWAAEGEAPLDHATMAAIGRARRALGADVATAERSTTVRSAFVAELVGRDREFAATLEAWQAVRSGASRHVHLVAPAGLGKTRLMQDLSTRLHHSGVAVRYLRAHPGDRELPGALAAEIARALTAFDGAKSVPPNVAAALVALDPSLANFYSAAPDPATGAEARRRRAFALAELFRATGEAGPYALLVDDLHWADDESFAILEALLARADEGRALLITATRPLQTRHLRSEHRLTLSLEPLTVAQVAELVGSLATLESDGVVATLPTGLATSTGGNPLLILELLQLARDHGILEITGGGWHCSDPDRLVALLRQGEGIRQRLARLGPESREAVRMLALAGSPLSATILARAIIVTPAVAAERLDLLERMGLAQRTGTEWEPAHDTIGDAAAEGTAAVLADARRRLADALEAEWDGSLPMLSRVMQLRRADGDVPAMARIVNRAITRERALGRRPAPHAITAQLLGGPRDDALGRAIHRALPAGTRWRPRFPAVAAVTMLALVMTAAVTARPTRIEPQTVLEVTWIGDDGRLAAAHVPLASDDWASEAPLVATFHAPSMLMQHLGPEGPIYPIVYSTGGDSAVTTGRRPSTGDLDLVLLTPDSMAWLTDAPRDDTAPEMLPDGSGVVFVTTRWSPEGDDDTDIALLRFRDAAVVQVTQDRDRDVMPRPSPDGLRIGFIRHARSGVTELCVVGTDGELLTCHQVDGLRLINFVGWLDNDHVLVAGDSVGLAVLSRLHLGTGQRDALARGLVGDPAFDPEGGILGCVCENPQTGQVEVRTMNFRYPGLWRAVQLPPAANAPRVAMRRSAPSQRVIARIAIAPPGEVRAGTIHQLRVRGAGVHGDPLVFDKSVVRWRSDDPRVATVDSASGLLAAVARGTVTIHAIAGMAQRDSLRIMVQPSMAEIVLVENWQVASPQTWRLYGDPLPELGSHPRLGHAMYNRGDGVDMSGAYTRTGFPVEAGLTVEALVASPIRRDKWQRHAIELVTVRDSVQLDAWHGRTGAPAGARLRMGTMCAVTHPYNEGKHAERVVSVVAGHRSHTVDAPPVMASGDAYRLRLVLFADGRCGVAVDDTALFISPNTVPMDGRKRLWIHGNSVGTDIAIGQVTVWRGDPGGVAWGKAP